MFDGPPPPAAWDSREVGRPGVLRLGDAWWLFYSGCDSWFEWKIGLAHSLDGEDWSRLDDAPLLVPPGTRVGGGAHSYTSPAVVEWPVGTRSLLLICVEIGDEPGSRLVTFRSSDGVTWAGATRVRLDTAITPPGAWIGGPSLVAGPEGLELFAQVSMTEADGTTTGRIVTAVSRDGLRWTATDGAPEWPGEFDHPWAVGEPQGDVALWCSVFGEQGWRIVRATRGDGRWSAPEEIDAELDGPWESAGILAPSVVVTDDGYWMWHLTSSRTSDGMATAISMRRSPDGRVWSKVGDGPVMRPRPGIPVRPW